MGDGVNLDEEFAALADEAAEWTAATEGAGLSDAQRAALLDSFREAALRPPAASDEEVLAARAEWVRARRAVRDRRDAYCSDDDCTAGAGHDGAHRYPSY